MHSGKTDANIINTFLLFSIPDFMLCFEEDKTQNTSENYVAQDSKGTQNL